MPDPKIEVPRNSWRSLRLHAAGWLVIESMETKARREVWLIQGDWDFIEVWDPYKKDWVMRCERRAGVSK